MERQMEHTGKWILGIHMAKGLKSFLFSELKGFCQLFIQHEFFECLTKLIPFLFQFCKVYFRLYYCKFFLYSSVIRSNFINITIWINNVDEEAHLIMRNDNI